MSSTVLSLLCKCKHSCELERGLWPNQRDVCVAAGKYLPWKWKVMWNSNSQRNFPLLALCQRQGAQVNAQNITVLMEKTFVPGRWYMNSHDLARKERLETEFLQTIICTLVSELTNGICITLKITSVALNGKDPLLYFLKHTYVTLCT